MKIRWILGIVLVIALLSGYGFANYLLTSPSTVPSTSCVLSPNGQFTQNGRVCDKVVYTLFKQGMSAYSFLGKIVSSNPYFYKLTSEGWQYLNSSKGGSYFSYTTHNLLTASGVTLLANQIHCNAQLASGGTCTNGAGFTTYTVQYLAISPSSTAPAATDTVCNSEVTEFGLTRTIATFTAGTASGGSISPVLKATWTAGSAYSYLQLGCAWNTNNTPTAGTGTAETGDLGVLYAENTFAPVNLNAGDQLTITWTFTYSG